MCPNICVKDLRKISDVAAIETSSMSEIETGKVMSMSRAAPLYHLKWHRIYCN
jgi:hypothetical protein